MNYAAGDVSIIDGCPDEWEEEEILKYLYSEEGLNLKESECLYMAGDEITLSQEVYVPKTKGE